MWPDFMQNIPDLVTKIIKSDLVHRNPRSCAGRWNMDQHRFEVKWNEEKRFARDKTFCWFRWEPLAFTNQTEFDAITTANENKLSSECVGGSCYLFEVQQSTLVKLTKPKLKLMFSCWQLIGSFNLNMHGKSQQLSISFNFGFFRPFRASNLAPDAEHSL